MCIVKYYSGKLLGKAITRRRCCNHAGVAEVILERAEINSNQPDDGG